MGLMIGFLALRSRRKDREVIWIVYSTLYIGKFYFLECQHCMGFGIVQLYIDDVRIGSGRIYRFYGGVKPGGVASSGIIIERKAGISYIHVEISEKSGHMLPTHQFTEERH